MSELTPAPYQVGQLVRVVLNDKNRTAHTGRVRKVVWHYKDQRFNFYLEANGQKVSKRYLAEDLVPVVEAPSCRT